MSFGQDRPMRGALPSFGEEDDDASYKKQPTVITALERSAIFLEGLEKAISVLYERLAPVIRPAEENESAMKSPGEDVPGGNSPLQDALRAQQEGIAKLTRRVEQITGELDL